MNEQAVQRDLGRLDAQVATLVATVAAQSIELAKINSTLSEAKGGWRLLMLVGGASATVGGLIVKFFPFVGSGPTHP